MSGIENDIPQYIQWWDNMSTEDRDKLCRKYKTGFIMPDRKLKDIYLKEQPRQVFNEISFKDFISTLSKQEKKKAVHIILDTL